MSDEEQTEAPQGMPMPGPGQQPSPEQIQAMQRQIAADAEKHGLSVPEYIAKLKEQAMAQHQAQLHAQQQQQQQQQQGQQQPIQPGPPKPEAIAVANWLKGQELKPRTVIHDEKRKDMFRGTETTTWIEGQC
jgi:translocation protein SEC62